MCFIGVSRLLLVAALSVAAAGGFSWFSFLAWPAGVAAPHTPTPPQEGKFVFAETDIDFGLIKAPTSAKVGV